MAGVQEWAEKSEELKISPQAIQKILCFSNQEIGFIPIAFYDSIARHMNVKGTKSYPPNASDLKPIIEPMIDKNSSNHFPYRMKIISKVKISIPDEEKKFHSQANLSCILNYDKKYKMKDL